MFENREEPQLIKNAQNSENSNPKDTSKVKKIKLRYNIQYSDDIQDYIEEHKQNTKES